MKLLLGLIVQLALILTVTSAEADSQKKRYVILGDNVEAMKTEARGLGATLKRDLEYDNGFIANLPPQAAEKLKQKLQERFGEDILVEEDAVITEAAQSTPWGISRVQARTASQYETGSGAIVCVLDSGIQPDHPDLKSNILGGRNYVEKNGTLNRYAWADDRGHGTHVAGTIAARHNTYGVVGVAPLAKLYAAKILDQNGSGYTSDGAEAIRNCVDEVGADVISMSLSTSSDSTVLRNAVKYAYSQGVILVAAAGNTGGSVRYPAKYPEVVAVAASDSSNRPASFTSRGPEVDFIAPGVSVYSTYIGSRYTTMSGTSMAAPHVAGVAALWVASGSDGMVGVDIGLHDYYQGDGLINAYRTVKNF